MKIKDFSPSLGPTHSPPSGLKEAVFSLSLSPLSSLLINLGLIDEKGIVDARLQTLPLPPLSTDELKVLKDHLTKTHETSFPKHGFRVVYSDQEIFRKLTKVDSFHLTGLPLLDFLGPAYLKRALMEVSPESREAIDIFFADFHSNDLTRPGDRMTFEGLVRKEHTLPEVLDQGRSLFQLEETHPLSPAEKRESLLREYEMIPRIWTPALPSIVDENAESIRAARLNLLVAQTRDAGSAQERTLVFGHNYLSLAHERKENALSLDITPLCRSAEVDIRPSGGWQALFDCVQGLIRPPETLHEGSEWGYETLWYLGREGHCTAIEQLKQFFAKKLTRPDLFAPSFQKIAERHAINKTIDLIAMIGLLHSLFDDFPPLIWLRSVVPEAREEVLLDIIKGFEEVKREKQNRKEQNKQALLADVSLCFSLVEQGEMTIDEFAKYYEIPEKSLRSDSFATSLFSFFIENRPHLIPSLNRAVAYHGTDRTDCLRYIDALIAINKPQIALKCAKEIGRRLTFSQSERHRLFDTFVELSLADHDLFLLCVHEGEHFHLKVGLDYGQCVRSSGDALAVLPRLSPATRSWLGSEFLTFLEGSAGVEGLDFWRQAHQLNGFCGCAEDPRYFQGLQSLFDSLPDENVSEDDLSLLREEIRTRSKGKNLTLRSDFNRLSQSLRKNPQAFFGAYEAKKGSWFLANDERTALLREMWDRFYANKMIRPFFTVSVPLLQRDKEKAEKFVRKVKELDFTQGVEVFAYPSLHTQLSEEEKFTFYCFDRELKNKGVLEAFSASIKLRDNRSRFLEFVQAFLVELSDPPESVLRCCRVENQALYDEALEKENCGELIGLLISGGIPLPEERQFLDSLTAKMIKTKSVVGAEALLSVSSLPSLNRAALHLFLAEHFIDVEDSNQGAIHLRKRCEQIPVITPEEYNLYVRCSENFTLNSQLVSNIPSGFLRSAFLFRAFHTSLTVEKLKVMASDFEGSPLQLSSSIKTRVLAVLDRASMTDPVRAWTLSRVYRVFSSQIWQQALSAEGKSLHSEMDQWLKTSPALVERLGKVFIIDYLKRAQSVSSDVLIEIFLSFGLSDPDLLDPFLIHAAQSSSLQLVEVIQSVVEGLEQAFNSGLQGVKDEVLGTYRNRYALCAQLLLRSRSPDPRKTRANEILFGGGRNCLERAIDLHYRMSRNRETSELCRGLTLIADLLPSVSFSSIALAQMVLHNFIPGFHNLAPFLQVLLEELPSQDDQVRIDEVMTIIREISIRGGLDLPANCQKLLIKTLARIQQFDRNHFSDEYRKDVRSIGATFDWYHTYGFFRMLGSPKDFDDETFIDLEEVLRGTLSLVEKDDSYQKIGTLLDDCPKTPLFNQLRADLLMARHIFQAGQSGFVVRVFLKSLTEYGPGDVILSRLALAHFLPLETIKPFDDFCSLIDNKLKILRSNESHHEKSSKEVKSLGALLISLMVTFIRQRKNAPLERGKKARDLEQNICVRLKKTLESLKSFGLVGLEVGELDNLMRSLEKEGEISDMIRGYTQFLSPYLARLPKECLLRF